MTKAWLRDLEERVQQASARLSELRAENAELQARVDELESQTKDAPSRKDVEAWSDERQEIRQRVEKLVEHLDDLLGE